MNFLPLGLRRARPDDSEKLKIFFAQESLGSEFEFRMVRKDRFDQNYRLQTSDFDTYLLESPSGLIEACGTMLFREGRIGSHFQTIGYATDLRVAAHREAIRTWAKHFSPSLAESMQRRGCHYVFSVVPGDRHAAFNTLIRPRSSRRQMPRFYLLRSFDVVAVHGQFPWSAPVPTLDVRRATLNDLEPLANFLNHRSRHRPMAFRYTADLLNFRLRTWPGLTIESFLLAVDSHGDIMGCVAPWSSQALSKIEVVGYQGFMSTLKGVLRMGSWLNWTRGLPNKGQEVRFRYLTHFYADNPDVFESLVMKSLDLFPDDHFQCYTHFEGYALTTPPRGVITTTFPFALYTVMLPGAQLPDELKPGLTQEPPELELCLL